MFAGGYLDKQGTQNDGTGNVITHEDKVNALTAYQNKMSHELGFGLRRTKSLAPSRMAASPLAASSSAAAVQSVMGADGDEVAIPAPQQLSAAFSDALPYADPTSPAKSTARSKASRASKLSRRTTGRLMDDPDLAGGDSEDEDAAQAAAIVPAEVPTMSMVMEAFPHKQPARMDVAAPRRAPSLKSTLPIDQGAYVAWRHGDDMGPTVANDTHTPLQRMLDMQKSRLALRRPGDDGTFDEPSEAEKAMALSMAITTGTPVLSAAGTGTLDSYPPAASPIVSAGGAPMPPLMPAVRGTLCGWLCAVSVRPWFASRCVGSTQAVVVAQSLVSQQHRRLPCGLPRGGARPQVELVRGQVRGQPLLLQAVRVRLQLPAAKAKRPSDERARQPVQVRQLPCFAVLLTMFFMRVCVCVCVCSWNGVATNRCSVCNSGHSGRRVEGSSGRRCTRFSCATRRNIRSKC